jgi:hypothetical protein
MDVTKWSEATRPLVTVVLIGTACYLAIVGTIDPKDFLSLATIVVLFWFKERADLKERQDQAKAITDAADAAATKP